MKKNIVLILLSLLLLIVVPLLLYSIISNRTTRTNFQIETTTIKKKNYNIKIETPKFNNKDFDKKIDNYIDSKKDKVKEESTKNYIDSTIHCTYTTYNDLYSILFENTFNEEKEYNIFYYDTKEKKEVFINDLIQNEEDLYKNVINNDKENTIITFSNDYINIIYLNQDNKLIQINYNDLSNYLNKEYFDIEIIEKEPEETENDTNNEEKEEVKEEQQKEDQPEQKQPENNTTTIEKRPILKPEVRNTEYFQNKKLLAITFDDGPANGNTTYLLDELDKRNAKVSFFLVGNRINNQSKIVSLINEKGHSIGSHSYNHKNLTKLSIDEINYELNTTNEAIKNATGAYPKYLRPPYGSYNSTILNATNMTLIIWNIDTLDWQYKDANTVANNIISKAKDGDIVLLHDLYRTSIDGALLAIDYLSHEGFAFVSLDELFTIKNVIPEKKAYGAVR